MAVTELDIVVKRPRRNERSKSNARDRILSAALAISQEYGPGHISLDAVARRAAVSKGGLLYHFPNKGELMRALVECHLEVVEQAARQAESRTDRPNAVATALVEARSEMLDCPAGGRLSGVLAALAENPDLLEPVRAYQRRTVERIRASATDAPLSLIAFLALEGMKAHDIFEVEYLTTAERKQVLDRLLELLNAPVAD